MLFRSLGQGVVARFDAETYSDAVAFARIGEGSLGGKARGLAFMNSMLMKHRQYDKYENVRIMIPRSVGMSFGRRAICPLPKTSSVGL